MYNRVFSGGVRVPPDYSGSAIKYHPAEEQGTMQTFCPPASKPTPPPQKPCGEGGECCPCAEKPSTCEKNGGHLGNLLSKISADDLLIYGIVFYMTLRDSDSSLMLLLLLALVML
ncbi:MAG: hypothetical protein PUJ72_06995 [Eubacteriales bacterium]|nr:hypothetical protein [Eubacteriales bacterium]MCI6971843.1 hypothetical protein [Eubacterium sp.]MDD7573979.1 hypothetical protein [Eubacteriales bacterium]MDY5355961.1 hypothetical protein [Eubacteriales bacterium]